MKRISWSLAFSILVASGLVALPMGERQIAGFEKEVVRIMRELATLSGTQIGDEYVLSLRGQTIRETLVKEAEIRFTGVSKRALAAFREGEGSFDSLRQVGIITVTGFLEGSSIQALIDREISRLKPDRRLFDGIRVTFGEGRANVSGTFDLWKVIPNPFGWLPQPQAPAPFTATVAVHLEGGEISIEIIEAVINGQPMADDLKKQILDWLNPVWDFTRLDCRADLRTLRLTPGGIAFSGSLSGN